MANAAERPNLDDEAALVRRASEGDMEAFEELVMRHADGVYVVLRRFGLTDDEARDVAQETFLRVARPASLRGSRALLHLALPDRLQRSTAAALEAAARASGRLHRGSPARRPGGRRPGARRGGRARGVTRRARRGAARAPSRPPCARRAARRGRAVHARGGVGARPRRGRLQEPPASWPDGAARASRPPTQPARLRLNRFRCDRVPRSGTGSGGINEHEDRQDRQTVA
jgi:hypothetical protein